MQLSLGNAGKQSKNEGALNFTTSTGTTRNDVRLNLEDGRTSAVLLYASLLLQLSVEINKLTAHVVALGPGERREGIVGKGIAVGISCGQNRAAMERQADPRLGSIYSQ